MRECSNCERLKERISELNSELLVMKIAALEARKAVAPVAPAPGSRQESPLRSGKRGTRALAGVDRANHVS